jgi:beta-lactam-binding protein with PASTA domain
VFHKTLAKAKTKIRQHHCKVGKVTRKASSNHLKGKVIKQSPKAGRRLANGRKVNLTVGKGGRQPASA